MENEIAALRDKIKLAQGHIQQTRETIDAQRQMIR